MKTANLHFGLRKPRGQNQMEFAAVFAVLILFVLLPLVDLVAIPVRMAFAGSAVKDTVHKLALSTKFSMAKAAISSGILQARLASISGVSLTKCDLVLNASSAKGGASSFFAPGTISKDWLPDGSSGPYHYNLTLSCEMEISPLFLVGTGSGAEIPGLTMPFKTKIAESYSWENLSKNPETQQFYLNE